METVLRVLLVYVFILLGLRIMGKREFSQLAPSELIMLMLIPELVSQGLIREDFSLTNGLLAVSTLLCLVWLTTTFVHLSKRFQKVIEPGPTILVNNGSILETNMNRERITTDELIGEIRKVGLYKLEQVRWAVLEGDGNVSVIPVGENPLPSGQSARGGIKGKV